MKLPGVNVVPLHPARPGAREAEAALSLAQVAQLSGVAAEDLEGLVEYGVLMPLAPQGRPSTFSPACVMTLQRADHLRRDLALDGHGFALAMMLLSRIGELEAELGSVSPQAQ